MMMNKSIYEIIYNKCVTPWIWIKFTIVIGLIIAWLGYAVPVIAYYILGWWGVFITAFIYYILFICICYVYENREFTITKYGIGE